jgi:WD40 repeat protein
LRKNPDAQPVLRAYCESARSRVLRQIWIWCLLSCVLAIAAVVSLLVVRRHWDPWSLETAIVGPFNIGAWSPDDSRTVLAGQDNTCRIYNMASGNVDLVLKGSLHPVEEVAYSSCGRWIFTEERDGGRIWDAATGEQKAFCNSYATIWTPCSSPDGESILRVEPDKIRILDVQGRDKATFAVGKVYCVAFSHDGRYIVSGGRDWKVMIWDAKDGRNVAALSGHRDRIRSVAYSPDDKYIASASRDGTVRVWDVARRKCLRTLKGNGAQVYEVAFFSDGSIVAGGEDGIVRVWDIEGGEQMVFHAPSILAVSIVCQGSRRIAILGKDGSMRILNADTGVDYVLTVRAATRNDSTRTRPSFSNDGRRLLFIRDDGNAVIWQLNHAEGRWGVLTLPSFWLLIVSSGGLVICLGVIVAGFRRALPDARQSPAPPPHIIEG